MKSNIPGLEVLGVCDTVTNLNNPYNYWEIVWGGQKLLFFVRRNKQSRTSSFIAVDTPESEDALDKYDAATSKSSEGGIAESVVGD